MLGRVAGESVESDEGGGADGGVLLVPWKSFRTSKLMGTCDDEVDGFAVEDTDVAEEVEGLPFTAGIEVD